MPKTISKPDKKCRTDAKSVLEARNQLPGIAEKIIKSCYDKKCYTHIDYDPLPSKDSVFKIINKSREILFPGYFAKEKIDPANLRYNMGQNVSVLFDMLAEQISNCIRHDCLRYNQECSNCGTRGNNIAIEFLEAIPSIRKKLATDVIAAFDGDPAAQSHDEIIFSYPGLYAIMVYRQAHKLFTSGVPLLPRMMTEYAHSLTGIDIHPGATIGDSFSIDHGTGVVIGETTVIGKNVRIYQGVTLGALSLPKDAGILLKGKKRHPTIEDDVIIYAGATILGGNTVIGARSVVGGNIWITESVAPDTTVVMENPQLIYKKSYKIQT
ncbi:MAG: serine acetyltransferase [Desulfobacterium sp.]|nr:serine acetyltransferase [Desulfobacterium sp.]MBU3949935.1 serine acetyltransferase [Pseudomonadota bacterium]MBU4037178.1 serine acetyltransferase [Pseudomonadota bacterium]